MYWSTQSKCKNKGLTTSLLNNNANIHQSVRESTFCFSTNYLIIRFPIKKNLKKHFQAWLNYFKNTTGYRKYVSCQKKKIKFFSNLNKVLEMLSGLGLNILCHAQKDLTFSKTLFTFSTNRATTLLKEISFVTYDELMKLCIRHLQVFCDWCWIISKKCNIQHFGDFMASTGINFLLISTIDSWDEILIIFTCLNFISHKYVELARNTDP